MKSLSAVFTAFVLLGMAAQPAWAEAGKDCPPVGSLPGYPADGTPELLAYQSDEFTVDKGKDTTKETVAGRYCRQSYSFKGKGDPMSVLEKVMNFRTQMAQIGA